MTNVLFAKDRKSLDVDLSQDASVLSGVRLIYQDKKILVDLPENIAPGKQVKVHDLESPQEPFPLPSEDLPTAQELVKYITAEIKKYQN